MSISTKVTGFTDQSGHTEYQLETTGPDGRAVSAQHRFSDFVELHTVIQPALKLPIAFPIPKSMFTGEAVKRERQQKLQEYLRTALAACDATPPLALMSFLGLRAGGPSGSGSAPDVANPPPASAESFAPFSEFQVVRKDDVNEGLRDAIMHNMVSFLGTVTNVPVGVLVEPLVKQASLHGYNNIDFDLLIALAK